MCSNQGCARRVLPCRVKPVLPTEFYPIFPSLAHLRKTSVAIPGANVLPLAILLSDNKLSSCHKQFI